MLNKKEMVQLKMVNDCYYSLLMTDKLYTCRFPALCALQSKETYIGEIIYCLSDIKESELEEKVQKENESQPNV
jgi:hypothetical protein